MKLANLFVGLFDKSCQLITNREIPWIDKESRGCKFIKWFHYFM